MTASTITAVRGNLAIRSHRENGKLLLLFETQRDRFRRFVGPMEYVDNYRKRIPDREGQLRDGIIFRLRPVTGVVFERLTEQKGLREGLRFLSSRDRALNAAQLQISASETTSTYWHRSAKETEVQM